MIRFERDNRTRGEQMFLRVMLQGHELARCDWRCVRPDDFAHDLHGRIFRHASRLAAQNILPEPDAVLASMRGERRGRGLQGVTEYIGWLAGDDAYFASGRVPALVAFVDAIQEQHDAQQADAWGRK